MEIHPDDWYNADLQPPIDGQIVRIRAYIETTAQYFKDCHTSPWIQTPDAEEVGKIVGWRKLTKEERKQFEKKDDDFYPDSP